MTKRVDFLDNWTIETILRPQSEAKHLIQSFIHSYPRQKKTTTGLKPLFSTSLDCFQLSIYHHLSSQSEQFIIFDLFLFVPCTVGPVFQKQSYF